jgi:hypothetical protein
MTTVSEPLRVITQTESWKQEASTYAIEMLEDWLARAKAGEIVAVSLVGECADGFTITGFTVPKSRAAMLGALNYMQHRILRDWDAA